MKKTSVSVGCLIALFCLFSCSAWAQGTKHPRMVIQEPVFDAGEVDEGKVITHSFLVSNRGDAPLLIKHVRPG
jgi:hypothetical protein